MIEIQIGYWLFCIGISWSMMDKYSEIYPEKSYIEKIVVFLLGMFLAPIYLAICIMPYIDRDE